MGSPGRGGARGWGGTPGAPHDWLPAPAAGSRSPRPSRAPALPGSSGLPQPRLGSGSAEPAALRCRLLSSGGARLWGPRGFSGSPVPGVRTPIGSPPVLATDALRWPCATSPFPQLGLHGLRYSGLRGLVPSAGTREALPRCPESGRRRGAEFIAVPSVVPEPVELQLSWVKSGRGGHLCRLLSLGTGTVGG